MSDEDQSGSKDKVVSFKKVGRLRPTGARKRGRHDDEEVVEKSSSESEGETRIVQRTKAKRPNPMVQATSSKRGAVQAAGDSESGDSETEERNRMLGVSYESSKTAGSLGPKDMGATATLESETAFDVDAQAQFERAQQIIKENRGKADDKVYRGISAYGQFREKKDSAVGNASSGLVRKGPIRAPNFLRQSVRWDYQPDLCKDYKETGFCGFGDSCKFLHDRTDYKHGWELERDWQEGRYGKDDADPHAFEIADNEDALPFKCLMCRNSFTNPIVTKCKHYFCEKCALDHYRKTQKCYVCEKNTGGVFNPAKEIIARLKGESSKRDRDGEESSLSETEANKEEEVATVEALPVEKELSDSDNDQEASKSDNGAGED